MAGRLLDGRDACLWVERWRGRRCRGEEAEERDEDCGDEGEEPEAFRNAASGSLGSLDHDRQSRSLDRPRGGLSPAVGAAEAAKGEGAGLSGSGDDVDGDAELSGCSGEQVADVVLGAEIELTPIGEPGGQAFGREPSRAAVAGGDLGSLVEQRARVEDLELSLIHIYSSNERW